jgi:menaquinol-cytochrome c reductase cytochrome b/c subunit
MVDIPESLLRRSAEAKAKALGVPVEQVLAEMKGEGPPVEVPRSAPEEKPEEGDSGGATMPEEEPEPVAEVPKDGEETAEPEVEADVDLDVQPAEPKEDEVATAPEESPAAMVAEAGAVAVAEAAEEGAEEPGAEEPAAEEPAAEEAPAAAEETPAAAVEEAPAAAVEVEEPESSPPAAGGGNGKVAAVVSPRPTVPPTGLPEGVRTQRLLTVVKARAIQNVKAEPTDKVNTWPHLMLMEFGALLLITGFLVVLSVIIHSPLLAPANFNSTPNPSKAPWYFLGLQELLSYFDPQIAGVMVPLFIGLIGFMMIPYIDKNPSTRPSDRKFAIMLFSFFLAGSATLTIIGVLFRGQGFNFSYPWRDGVFFDDLKDWVHFE